MSSTYSSSARPRTTGSLGQSVVAARRQSMGSIRSVHTNRPPSGHQHQHQQPRLTRNLTLGDLRWTASTAMAAIAGGPNAGGADGDSGRVGGGSGGVMARRGWQAGAIRGGSSSGVDSGSLRQPVTGDSSGRLRSGSAEAPSGDMLSRLPLLESTSPPGKLRQQQQHQQLQLQGNAHVSVENSDLSEHGLSFGLSALKGRRPYMEDEFKVGIITGPCPLRCVDRARARLSFSSFSIGNQLLLVWIFWGGNVCEKLGL